MPSQVKCDISKCHAACCYNVPMPKRLVNGFRKKVVNPIIQLEHWDDNTVIPITNSDPKLNKCPFLTSKCKCNIYEYRPQVCRYFGSRPDLSQYLRCGFLEGKDASSIKLDKNPDALIFEILNNFTQLKGLIQ